MSNKNNKNGNNRVVKGNIVATITANLNKHGEIKGSNKKETKNLKAMCPHHKETKKGKNKAMVWNNGDGSLKCTMCDNRVPTDLKSKEDVKKTISPTQDLLSQARYMTVAADLGKEEQAYFARLSVDLANFPKVYGRVKHIVEKRENMRKRKKKNGNRNNSGVYGGWR